MKYQKLLFVFLLITLNSPFNIYAKDKLIPLEDFAKHGQYQQMKISKDAKHLAFTYREGTEVKLAIMNRAEKKIISIFEYGDWRQVVNFYWGNNERIIMEVQKRVGYLDKKARAAQLIAADIDGRHRKQIYTVQRSGYRLVSLLDDDPKNIIVVKSHGADYNRVMETGKSTAVKLNIYTGRSRKILGQPKEDVSSILFDSKDQMRVAVQVISDKEKFGFREYFVYIKNMSTGTWERSDILGHTKTIFGFRGITDDGKYAYVTSDSETKTSSLYKLSLLSGEITKVFEHDYVDIGGMITTEDKKIIGFRYSPDYNQVKFLDKTHKESIALASLFQAFPGQDVSFTSYTEGASEAVVIVSSDINPGEFYLYNFEKSSLKYLASRMSWIDPKQMSKMQPIKYTTRDGVEIHGYLTLPKSGADKNLPLVIHPHGGPHGPRDRWGFNPDVQFMASRGYAVLQMNFRGSGGYGMPFQESGYRKWGREMQDDVTDATLWAVENGIANPDKICIYGGSYGGYATLMGVVKEPDLYKCGLGYVGVYDMETFYTSGDIPNRASGVRYLEHVIGRDVKEMRANSPARNVERIKAKLFIAHGEEDVRVPMEQYEVLTEALDKANIPYRSMVRDEGHGYQKIKNRIDFYKAMEEFFAESLN
jgi:dipeptidyl aminopeptidase/acylaminoacyl peptidase